METVDYLLIGLLAAILGLAVFFVCRSKKKGKKCIGCPYAQGCAGSCHK